MRERYVLLGLARARAEWFRTVGQWATSAMLPAEFVRCVSLEELRARLRSGRPFSAVLVDGTLPGFDRDVIAEATEVGVSVLVVDDGARDWRGLGAAAVLPAAFSRDELMEVLAATSQPVGAATYDDVAPASEPSVDPAPLYAVTGAGGTGASTLAIALAQGLAAGETETPDRHRRRRRSDGGTGPSVLLADLCRTADQAMLHDARVVVPSVQEVVEAHRTGVPERRVLLDQTFEVATRGYRLLLGLRRPRHWVALRPRALESALDSMQRSVDVVVADVEADVEGEAETGSVDVEERNLLSRATLARAEVTVVVAEPSMKGLHAAVRTIHDLLSFGVPATRLLPVINRAPRSPRGRAELTTALGDLLRAGVVARDETVEGVDAAGSAAGDAIASPLHLPERGVDVLLRDGAALPTALARPLARAVQAVGVRAGAPAPTPDTSDTPEPVAPGSLSAFTSQEQPGS